MKEEKNSSKSFSAVLEEKKQGFKSLKKDTRVAIYVGASGLILASVFSAGYAMKNKYDVLFTGLDDIDANNIVSQLEEDNIDVKIEGSTVYVPKNEVDRLRLKLSSTITNGSQGFELMDNSSFGMTDEEFQLKKQRMIQGEIERTIKTFPQIESARVHITPGEESVFAKEANPGTSAVYVNLKAGRSLTEAQVASIVSLVSASSYNIPKQNVEVIDQNMNLLSEGMFDEKGVYNSSKNLSELDTARKAEKEYNEDLKASLKELLEPIFGAGKVKISVNTDLNFDTEDKKVLVVDPNRVAIKEHKAENSSGDGPSSGSPVDNNMSAPAIENNGDTTKSLEEDTDYITGQSETVTSVAKGGIRNISTSVVIDGIQNEETLQMVEQMVQTAVGYNPNRGDKVSVVSMTFSNEIAEAEKARLEKEKKDAIIKMATITGGSLGTIALVALIITIINKKKKKAIEEGVLDSEEMTSEDIIASAIAEVEEGINNIKEESTFGDGEKAQLTLDDEIKEFATKNPEQTVELLKIWLNE